MSSQKQMIDAIAQEIVLQKEYLESDQVETIYFGGGTPSLLSSSELRQLLGRVYGTFDVVPTPEICLEANPDDLTQEKLSEMFESGINRLSIGIQSFDDGHLTYLNRAHSRKEALNCVSDARQAGIDNISIDLIYAIPSHGHDVWEKDLAQAIALRPEHISSYCLTIEGRTAFGNWLKRGKIKPINEEFAAQQFEILLSTLNSNGYEQYEISNFCLSHQYSKHNSNYWKQEKYLGVGPSAHSYNGISRQFNISHNKKYLSTISQGDVPFTLDSLSHNDHINEYLLTTLRTKWGTDLNNLKEKYATDLLAVQGDYIEGLLTKELAMIDSNALILTDKGKLFADKIASDLFFM